MQIALLALASLVAPSVQDAPKVQRFDSIGLTVTFPAEFAELELDLESVDEEDGDLGAWNGKLGDKELYFEATRTEDDPDDEPSEITWRIHDHVRSDDWDGDQFLFAEHRLVPGNFGFVPYASYLHGATRAKDSTKDTGYSWYVSGISKKNGYLLFVYLDPPPSEAEKKIVAQFLTSGVAYAGPKRVNEWTDDELAQRWKKDVPFAGDKKKGAMEVIRTTHYAVMTNSSGGKKFAEQMETNYLAIQKVFPFAEVPGRKLMPVFLFRTPDEYYAFCVARFEWSQEEAEESKGVAASDFYSTWYEAPNDPVHIHEATHQIFDNRLELGGGGSWFQEGVAEYIETKPNERNVAARAVKNGKHTPLRELMRLDSLLGSSEDDVSGESAAANHYKEAALLIEFLRESKFGKDKFAQWMHAIGNVEDEDLSEIEAVCRRVYSVSIEELDRAFQEYCKKR